jgi:hypothetical protein
MGIDIALIVANGNASLELGLLQMAAWPIDAVIAAQSNAAAPRLHPINDRAMSVLCFSNTERFARCGRMVATYG